MSSKLVSMKGVTALKTLQPTADKENQLVGGRHLPQTKKKGDVGRALLKPIGKQFVSVPTTVIATQTDSADVAEESCQTEVSLIESSVDVFDGDSPEAMRDMLTASTPSSRYLELLAESRRRALETTLAENLTLHRRIAALEHQTVQLQQQLADAQQWKQMVQEALDADDDEQ